MIKLTLFFLLEHRLAGVKIELDLAQGLRILVSTRTWVVFVRQLLLSLKDLPHSARDSKIGLKIRSGLCKLTARIIHIGSHRVILIPRVPLIISFQFWH